jgi:hypothetical protein
MVESHGTITHAVRINHVVAVGAGEGPTEDVLLVNGFAVSALRAALEVGVVERELFDGDADDLEHRLPSPLSVARCRVYA